MWLCLVCVLLFVSDLVFVVIEVVCVWFELFLLFVCSLFYPCYFYLCF